MNKIKTEPALVVSVIVGIITAIYPSVVISDHTIAILTAVISVVFSLIGGLVIRGKVTPTSVLNAVETEAKTDTKEAVVYAQLHPDQVAEIVKEVQTQTGRQKLEEEAITALTTGDHPMTLEPGADSTVPAPDPQGTYDAAQNPIHATYVPAALTPVPVTMPPVANGSTPVQAP